MRPVEEPTVTTDGYAKSMAAHLPRIPPPIRRRLEYTALIELHLDIPSMQCDQRGAMPDGDDGRVRQNLARHAVDLRFQRLVKRRRHLTEEQPIRLSRIARAIARRCRSSPEKALGPVVLVVNLAGNRRAAVWCQAPRLVDQRTGKSPFCHARAPPKPPIRRSPWSFVTNRGIGEARNLTDDRDERDQMDQQSEDLNRDGDRCRGPVGRWLNSLASIRIGRGHPENPRQGAPGQSASGFTNPSQYMCWPPLTESVEPVMKSASSATRNSTAREMSSGLPRRPTGIRAMIFVTTSAGTARTMSVLT